MKDNGHTVHFTQIEDGSYLAASVSVPRFCVGAPTLDEVKAKAERALRFYSEQRSNMVQAPARRRTIVTPVYHREALCA